MMNHAVCKNRVSLMHPWSEKEMKKLDQLIINPDDWIQNKQISFLHH